MSLGRADTHYYLPSAVVVLLVFLFSDNRGDVELRAVPSSWGPSAVKYRYFYSDNHVYLVEPSTREVVTIID